METIVEDCKRKSSRYTKDIELRAFSSLTTHKLMMTSRPQENQQTYWKQYGLNQLLNLVSYRC